MFNPGAQRNIGWIITIIIIIQGLGASGEDISGVVVPSIPQNGEQNLQVKFKIERQY